ncbi:MAG: hypothetical protein WC069_00330 [Candidatus Shapirobacteria bacterium]
MFISDDESLNKSEFVVSTTIENGLNYSRSIVEINHSELGFHNLDHNNDTRVFALKMIYQAMSSGNINNEDGQLLLLAVGFHDVVQGNGPIVNERMSADIARKWMEENKEYTEENIALVEKIIMGTAIERGDDGKMHQLAEHVATGNPNTDLLIKMMADIDLFNIGATEDIFENRSLGLWNEMSGTAYIKVDDMDIDEQRKFWTFEHDFLEGRNYLTNNARQLSPNIENNQILVNQKIANLTV